MNSSGTVRLLDAEPDLGKAMTREERELAAQVVLPVMTLEPGELSPSGLRTRGRAFAAIVLEGMVLHRIAIGEHGALRLLGPGDMLTLAAAVRPSMLADAGYRVTSLTRLAVLEDHMLLAIRRFPQLSVGLHMRMADQHERLAAQLVICQLPRVEDRVLAMMWLLAESWGRVTSSGTALPISLTHDALGELIGAKRPTVTLALRELSERGALVRTDQGWLLLEPLDEAEAIPSFGRHPAVIGRKLSPWAPESAPEPASEPGDTLQQTLRMLQADHQRNAASYQARVELSDATRERSRELRELIRRDRLSRRPPS